MNSTARMPVAAALAAIFIAVPAIADSSRNQTPPDAAVKAAFLFNFAQFTEWAALPPGFPITVCIVGDDKIAAALVRTIGGRDINGSRSRGPAH